jgi:hypothetical protein
LVIYGFFDLFEYHGNRLGLRPGIFGEFADLIGHHGETLPRFSSVGGFYGGVHGQKVRLACAEFGF